jgi:hypothetical protein
MAGEAEGTSVLPTWFCTDEGVSGSLGLAGTGLPPAMMGAAALGGVCRRRCDPFTVTELDTSFTWVQRS